MNKRPRFLPWPFSFVRQETQFIQMVKCLICDLEFENGKKLSNHTRTSHKIDSLLYTIKFKYNGVRPICLECGSETRYTSFDFKKYCINHSNVAESKAGRIGGKKKTTWNKGKKFKDDKRISRLFGEDNHFFGKKHTEETIELISKHKTLSKQDLSERSLLRSCEWELLTPLEEYKSRQGQKLKFKCKVCSLVEEFDFQAFERGHLCGRCYSAGSTQQESMARYIESLGFDIIRNDKKMISPMEIDVYVPSLMTGFEFDGLYWHTFDDHRKCVKKHSLAKEKNIKLFQIFSDEWLYKGDICRSMISHRLGVTKRKINARDCSIREVDIKESSKFMEDNHLSGNVNHSYAVGLFFQNELVMLSTVRKPFHKNDKIIELARMAPKLWTVVVGGASRLTRHIINEFKEKGYEKLISYADLRIGCGNVYSSSGFKHESSSSFSYWYTDGKIRYNRFKFRATKELSETEVALNAGVKKVFGPGHARFSIDIS